MRKCISIILLLFLLAVPAYAQQQSAGKVIKVTGDVLAVQEGMEARALQRGSDIYEKDTVVTSALGLVSLRFTDGTLIELASDSEYAISSYEYNEEKPDNDSFTGEIVKGSFRAISGKIGARNPSAFVSKARMTTLTVRGTAFYMTIPSAASNLFISNTGLSCQAVSSLTVEGTTSVKFDGNAYNLGEGESDRAIEINCEGDVKLSDIAPAGTQDAFDNTIDVLRVQEQQYDADVEAGNIAPTSKTLLRKPGSGSNGGNNDPCGTLDAVRNQLK